MIDFTTSFGNNREHLNKPSKSYTNYYCRLLHVMKISIRTQLVPCVIDRTSPRSMLKKAALLATMLLALLLPSFTVSAFVLDDFNGASLSGWTSTLNSGSVVQSAGQLTITTVAFPQGLTYSKKTDHTFTTTAGDSLEFKVQVNSIGYTGAETNGTAVLGWVPTGGALGANGYAMGVSTGSVAIRTTRR